MLSNTIDMEFALIEFLYTQTKQQLEEKGHDFPKIKQMALIDAVVRANFPKCIEYEIARLTVPPKEVHDELD